MTKTRTHYSREFKIQAIELSKQRGNLTSVVAELNISYDNLKRWKKEYKSGLFDGSSAKIKNPEAAEITKLKKELYHMTMERDILKKAVSIFSKSDR
ncbi:MAG: transposase [Rhabdochlamydiaceae bacterium]